MYDRYKKRFIIVAFSILFLAVISACIIFARNHHPVIAHEKLTIVCTTSILTDTVKQIVGEHADVHGLMGPGIDPHLYRAKPSDAYAVAQADIIFYNGLHLEGKMTELFKKLSRHKLCVGVGDILEENDLIPSQHRGIYDPHIWHDVLLWKKIVDHIVDIVATHDHTHSDEYHERAEMYKAELDALDIAIKEQVASLAPEQRILITAHDAFSYFGKAYGFQIVSLQGISTETEINTKDIESVVTCVVAHRVRAIFLESSIAPGSIQALTEAVQARGQEVAIGPELFSDALGDTATDADSYTRMMLYNSNALVTALHTP